MSSPRVTVITLALGRRFYLDLAINLARSFLRFHDPKTITFRIISDLTAPLPPDLRGCDRQWIDPGKYGTGFSPKIHLEKFAPDGPTLLLDSDILIYEPLDRLLSALRGHPVATVGREVNSGEWFGDVASYCAKLGVAAIPRFNGGLYYMEPGDKASAVYETARSLAKRYDELGLVRLRGQPDDELVMAGAMASHGLRCLYDDGSYMADPMACQGPMKLDVLHGRRLLVNPPPPSPLHQVWNPFHLQSPTLVHFLGEHALLPYYRAEVVRLRLAAKGWPIGAASLAANVGTLWPGKALLAAKAAVRPLAHSLVGPRRVRPTPREGVHSN
jgi:hypothetical protein